MTTNSATPGYTFPTPTPLPLQAAFDGGRLTSDGGLPWLAQSLEAGIGRDADGILHVLLLTHVIERWRRKAAIRPDEDLHARPALLEHGQEAFEDCDHAPADMGIAGPQHGRDQLIGVAIEEQQRVIHVLPIVGMVGGAFLRAIGWVIRAIQVQQDARGHPVALALPQIELDQGDGQPIAGAAVHGVVEAREGGL